jgi:hypothetical protein
MAITLATGTMLAIATSYGPVVDMTALSNASEGVAELDTGHGCVVGDYLEVVSGWDLLNLRIARAKTVVGDNITLEGIDTSNTTNYPPGTGIGSIRRITGWTNIGQIQSVSGAGGDLNFADVTTITDRTQKQVPTTRSAKTTTLNLFDDPSLAGQAAIQAANDTNALVAQRISYANGSKMLKNGYWSIGEPDVNSNAALTASVGFSAFSTLTRYAT